MNGLGAPFWRMYASSATSNLADGVGRVGIPLLAAAYTRNPLAISGLTTFAFLPWLLFALPSGALIDRIDRRRAMAVANVVRACASGVLCVLVVTHEGSIAVLYVVAFALGAAETVYESSARALLPSVVPAAALDGANSLLTVEETLGQTFIGAPAGSALFALAVVSPFVLNAGGFLLAAALIVTLRGDFRPRRAARTSVRRDMSEGLAWLRAHALLRGLTLISGATAFMQSLASGVLVLYCLEVLHVPAGGFGLVLLAAGGGAVVGGLATPLLATRYGRPATLTVGALVSAVATFAMAFADNGFVGGGLFAVAGAGVMTWNVLTMSLRQALIPPELFGRVQGAYRTLVFGAVPLGSLAGGALAGPLGLRGVFALSGVGLLGCALALGRLVRQHRVALAATCEEREPVSSGSARG